MMQLETLGLPELVEELEDLQQRRTPVGWTPDDAVLKSRIERRIMELVGSIPPGDERRRDVRLPCTLSVKIRSKKASARGETRDVGVGGVFVATVGAFPVGTPVEIEVRGAGTDEHGLRVRGQVAWIGGELDAAGVGVCFAGLDNERHERRLRRFVIELLRHRVLQ